MSVCGKAFEYLWNFMFSLLKRGGDRKEEKVGGRGEDVDINTKIKRKRAKEREIRDT
jgi:hypothetical protein